MKKLIFMFLICLNLTGCGKNELPKKVEWLKGHTDSELEMANTCIGRLTIKSQALK